MRKIPILFLFLGLCNAVPQRGWSFFAPNLQKNVLEIIRKPYTCECPMIDKEIYNVCFYMTQPTILGQSRKVLKNLTILVSKTGLLPGWSHYSDNHFVGSDEMEAEMEDSISSSPKEEDSFWPTEITMSYRTKKEDKDAEKKSDTDDEAIPNDESRDMLQDDAEDDFNSW